MKKIVFLSLLAITSILNAQNINVLYNFRTYHSTKTNYVEINTSIESATLNTASPVLNKYIKQAELTIAICNSTRPDSVIYIEKRVISSPQVEDSTTLNNTSLLDMQRIALHNGSYVVFFELKDVNSTSQPLTYKDAIIMNYPEDEINVSDIMIVNKHEKTKKENIYSKGGYDLQPYMFDAISKDDNKVSYYAEIYNADKVFGKDSLYLISTIIEDINSNKKIETVQAYKRQKAQDITPYFNTLDLSSLPEGAYYLTVEARDKDNLLYAYNRYPFIKHSNIKAEQNDMELPKDAFVYYIPDSLLKETIKSMRPIASNTQVEYMLKDLKTSTPDQDRYFIYQFFSEINSSSPEFAYRNYAKQVEKINEKYSTRIKKGYNTDMGRILLSYGEPTEIIDEKSATSGSINNVTIAQKMIDPDLSNSQIMEVNYYPYQIWVYSKTPMGESNRKFVFYAKQNNMAEYFLLHSNATGELQDLEWESVLSHGTLDRGVIGKAGKQFQTGRK